MRKTSLLLLAIITLSFVACDDVEDPYEHLPKVSSCQVTDSSQVIQKTSDQDFGARKLLLEEYTGIRCGNCPDMANIINSISATFGDSVIVVALQAYTSSLSAPDDKHPIDLRNPALTVYDGSIQNGSTIPYALVNDKSSNGKAGQGNVRSMSEALLKDASWHTSNKLKLSMKSSFSQECNSVLLEVNSEALADLPNGANLIVYLLENNMEAPQTQYNALTVEEFATWNDENPEYPVKKKQKHKHVLRAAYPSPWGEELFVSSTSAGTIANNVINFCIEPFAAAEYTRPDIVPENCDLVALAYDLETKEILFSEIIHSIAQ